MLCVSIEHCFVLSFLIYGSLKGIGRFGLEHFFYISILLIIDAKFMTTWAELRFDSDTILVFFFLPMTDLQ